MSLFGSSPSTIASAADYVVPNPPSDGISSLAFNPTGTALIAGSWDTGVRCWELQRSAPNVPPVAIPRAQMNHSAPVLCTAFHSDGSTAFSGGLDNMVKKWSLAGAGQPTEDVGKHDGPVRKVQWIHGINLLASGSWDKTIKFWDLRTPQPAHTLQLSERLYDMDIRDNWMVACTADRQNRVYNLAANCRLESCAESTLKYQTRCAAIFPDLSGYAVGSIEGRVAIEYFNELPNADGVARTFPTGHSKRAFAFKCHRESLTGGKGGGGVGGGAQTGVYSINTLSFHPYGTFATGGSDGTFNFWDKDSRQRLKQFPKQQNTISAGTFTKDGTLYGYAASYDWSQGVEQARAGAPNAIMLHVTGDEEIKPRDKPPRK